MALSDLTVRQARTTGKRYTISDNDCLGLMVSAAGGKSWIFRYYWLGKQKRLSLAPSQSSWPVSAIEGCVRGRRATCCDWRHQQTKKTDHAGALQD